MFGGMQNDPLHVPAGWNVALEETDRQSALDFVEREWTDMRPKSLIRAMEDDA